jgi:hypothetical protein
MDLTSSVLQYARSKGEKVADIARGRIRYVDDFRRIEGAFIRGLFAIDAGCRRDNIYLLKYHLFVGQRHLDRLTMSICLSF